MYYPSPVEVIVLEFWLCPLSLLCRGDCVLALCLCPSGVEVIVVWLCAYPSCVEVIIFEREVVYSKCRL